ncbi:MAG: hypothetical protein HYU27_07655, partial [Acidobacteria bacterium]|nr:hypothetical protein [Acidobacteriota bacterium]
MQPSIQQFTLSLLAYKGALIEPEERSAGVLLGTEMASALGMNEYERLVFDPAANEANAIRVDYDAPFFEAAGRFIDSFGSLACLGVETPELKDMSPERELERGLRLQNGIFRLQECVPAEMLYLCFSLRYDAIADERSGGVLEVWVNPEARSIATMAAVLDQPEAGDAPSPPDLAAIAAKAWDLAKPAASSTVMARVTGFGESLKRRRERDLRRMTEYYQAIDQEIRRKIARAQSRVDARRTEIQRLDATHRAYEARAAELLERYRMRVQISVLGVLAARIPAYRLRVQLMRRTRKTEALFSWNPFDKRIERRCCDACQRPTESALLCDDQVHYLCLNCLAPCPV